MRREVRNEKDRSLSVLSQAVDHFQRLHPLDDGILVALFGDVHFPGHAMIEQLSLDDGELVERGVADREHLHLVVVHLCAGVEKLDHEGRAD